MIQMINSQDLARLVFFTCKLKQGGRDTVKIPYHQFQEQIFNGALKLIWQPPEIRQRLQTFHVPILIKVHTMHKFIN